VEGSGRRDDFFVNRAKPAGTDRSAMIAGPFMKAEA
jgi:hypothetical protein